MSRRDPRGSSRRLQVDKRFQALTQGEPLDSDTLGRESRVLTTQPVFDIEFIADEPEMQDAVYVTEQILVPDALREPYDPADPYRQIGARYTVREDGHQISEWRLELADIRAFVARRAGQYIPA